MSLLVARKIPFFPSYIAKAKKCHHIQTHWYILKHQALSSLKNNRSRCLTVLVRFCRSCLMRAPSVKSKDVFIISCSKKCCKIEAIWFYVNLEVCVKFSVCLLTLLALRPSSPQIFFFPLQLLSVPVREVLYCVRECVVNNLCSRGLWMGGCFNDLMGHSKDSFHRDPWRLSERYEAAILLLAGIQRDLFHTSLYLCVCSC